jgi:insulysin
MRPPEMRDATTHRTRHIDKNRFIKQIMGAALKLCCWYAAAVLLVDSSALAFCPSAPNTNIRATTGAETVSLLAVANDNESVGIVPSTTNDIDSRVRRQLVLSLLATASTSAVLFAADAATATTISNVEASASHTSTAELIKLIKPPLDQRKYETYELPNGLKVLLCSDPTSTTAAVGMNVHVGACSDPVEIPGLAHFCEHMLFLGTEKYPEEDSFAKFLSSNGGYNNAFTDSEKTVYYFEMDGSIDKRFSEALLRFGSFFSGPLFTESATGRELNAIDSENAKNLQNDIFRLYELEKDRVNSEHPYAKFFTGNKKTLLEGTKRQGINLRNELVKFYETYYSSNQMSLAVVAPQNLSQLRKFASDAFGDIPNRESNPPEDKWAFKIQPYIAGKSKIPAEKTVVEIVPIQELRQVTITWPIIFSSKEERKLYRLNKPDYFVSSLLGHEGAGSLLSYLKEKRWANALGASDNADLSDFATFEVTVELTPKGLNAIDDVCETIFSYIQMMRNTPIPNYVFDENLQLDELEWRFTTKGQPSNYVQSLVTAMDKFPPSLYIAGPRRLALQETSTTLISSDQPRTAFKSNEQREIIKAACTDFIKRLTVDNSFLTVFSKSFEGQTSQTEEWYGTAYNVKPVSMSALMKWNNPSSFPLFYPRKNIFIPSESGLKVNRKPKKVDQKALTFEEKIKRIPPPTIIRDDGDEGRWTVHFKEDDRFGKPKAFLIFQLLTDELYSSPTKAVLGMLYQQCAGDKMNEETVRMQCVLHLCISITAHHSCINDLSSSTTLD